jgi:hypothetical protein
MRVPNPEELFAASPAPTEGAAFENPLGEYFLRNPGRQIHKWHHYFEIYHRHLERFRGRSPVVIEFGVQHGGSMQMWREYFGPGAQIVGVDIDARCSSGQEESIEIVIGDQADRNFLASLRQRYPRVDVVIDDGGHTMEQQLATFQELYLHLQPQGVYICEDLHTSYFPSFGGGFRRPDTFIEFAKGLVDWLNGWYCTEPGQELNAFPRSTHGMHFYDSMLVLEKRPMEQPRHSRTGKPLF